MVEIRHGGLRAFD